jgi:glutathione S-transferase
MTRTTEGARNLEALARLFPTTVCNAQTSELPEIHLFHAPNSVCSQKVRIVLFEADAPFYSHQLNVGKGDTYQPAYVRLRAEACQANGFGFAADHRGSTSVTDMGCDACVVPTVIDEVSGTVLIDSLRICIALDEQLGAGLRPDEFASAIDHEISIVDSLPNYPLLASKMHGSTADGGNSFALGKASRCEALIAAHADEPLLVAAYAAKRDKELAANDRLFTPAALAQAEQDMRAALEKLADRLPPDQDFRFSDRMTLADIFWAVELIRNRDIGYGAWVDVLPRLAEYEARLRAVPSVQQAILEWAGAKPHLLHST